MTELHPDLRENVRLLGDLLGQSIRQHPGQECFDLIEEVRAAAKSDRRQESGSGQRLVSLLWQLIVFGAILPRDKMATAEANVPAVPSPAVATRQPRG